MLHPIYYIILFIITFFSYLEFTNNSIFTKAYIKKIYILIVLLLIFIGGTRLAGADYMPYLIMYIDANKYISWNEVFDASVEPTYVIISKILGYFRMPFFALLTVFAIISVSLKTSTYFKYSPYPMLSLLYFFMPFYFFEDLGHIRQSAGMACCLFSYRYIEKKQLFKFLLCVLIGYYFHKTAVVFLPAYWIANAYISTRQCVIILIISIIISPFKPYLLFGNLFENISIDVLSHATGGYFSYQSLEGAGFTMADVVKIIIIFIILFNDNYIINTTDDKNYMKMRNLVICYFFLYYSLKENVIFSVRLPGYYSAFYIILIAMIIKYSAKNISKLIYFYVIIYIYLMSWRFWPNSVALGFDKFSNVFNTNIDINNFIPYEFADKEQN